MKREFMRPKPPKKMSATTSKDVRMPVPKTRWFGGRLASVSHGLFLRRQNRKNADLIRTMTGKCLREGSILHPADLTDFLQREFRDSGQTNWSAFLEVKARQFGILIKKEGLDADITVSKKRAQRQGGSGLQTTFRPRPPEPQTERRPVTNVSRLQRSVYGLKSEVELEIQKMDRWKQQFGKPLSKGETLPEVAIENAKKRILGRINEIESEIGNNLTAEEGDALVNELKNLKKRIQEA